MYKTTVPVFFLQPTYKEKETIEQLKKMKADRVALIMMRNLDYKFSPPHELERLTKTVEVYKNNGFETMVWLGETFGHDPLPPIEGISYTNMRFFDKGDISPFCPLDEKFRSAFCEWIKDIARSGADAIMMDDDYRLGHRPGGLACCCELHMARLKAELNEDFTEEQFKNLAFNGGENKYRNAWIKVCGDTMREFSHALRSALNTVNPSVRLGFCTTPSHWDSEGADAIEIATILAGDTKPFIRLGGAPYWCDHKTPGGKMIGLSTIGEVVEYARAQASWCKDANIETFCEGDTYPRPRFTTSAAYLECFDTIVRACGETNGILKYTLDYVSSPKYETGYIDFCKENETLYSEIDALFADKKTVGLKPFNEMRLLQKRSLDITKSDTFEKIQNNLSNNAKLVAIATSFPISYEDNAVNIIFGENAKYIDESKLPNGSIIDLDGAEFLMERGIDVGVERIDAHDEYVKKSFVDWPKEFYINENDCALLEYLPLYNPVYKRGVEVLTKFFEGESVFDAVALYQNAKGYKFMILPVRSNDIPRGFLDTYAKRRVLSYAYNWLSSSPLKVNVCGNHPYLYLLEKENDDAVAVGVWNLFQDKIKNLRFKINTAFSRVNFVNCSGVIEGNEVVLDGTLYPYEFAGIEVKLKN